MLDLFARRAVGWAFSLRPDADLVDLKEDEALEKGMEAKAVEFVKTGAEVYRKV